MKCAFLSSYQFLSLIMPHSSLVIVEAYLDAITQRDHVLARSYLADCNFSYVSPMNSFDTADALMAHFELISPIKQHIKTRKAFVDGSEVCHILVETAQITEQPTTVAQWAQVCDDKISRLELIFDAHEYKKLLV